MLAISMSRTRLNTRPLFCALPSSPKTSSLGLPTKIFGIDIISPNVVGASSLTVAGISAGLIVSVPKDVLDGPASDCRRSKDTEIGSSRSPVCRFHSSILLLTRSIEIAGLGLSSPSSRGFPLRLLARGVVRGLRRMLMPFVSRLYTLLPFQLLLWMRNGFHCNPVVPTVDFG